jgi:transcriptional regulator with XRE-family HTH domain
MKLPILKEKAKKYRSQGYSYGIISKKLGLAKSTLSNWLKEFPYSPNKRTLKRIRLALAKSAKIIHNKKLAKIEIIKKDAHKELGKITRRDLWLLGIGLYIGEGNKLSKESVRLINSNAETIKLAMRWFREIFRLKDKNFSLSVHLYPDNNINLAKNYWSKITGIPKIQFGKTQIDQRTNKSSKKIGKLKYGTLHVQIKSCGNEAFGVSLHRRIMGWIEAVSNQI